MAALTMIVLLVVNGVEFICTPSQQMQNTVPPPVLQHIIQYYQLVIIVKNVHLLVIHAQVQQLLHV